MVVRSTLANGPPKNSDRRASDIAPCSDARKQENGTFLGLAYAADWDFLVVRLVVVLDCNIGTLARCIC